MSACQSYCVRSFLSSLNRRKAVFTTCRVEALEGILFRKKQASYIVFVSTFAAQEIQLEELEPFVSILFRGSLSTVAVEFHRAGTITINERVSHELSYDNSVEYLITVVYAFV